MDRIYFDDKESNMKYFLVIYDISNDKRRNKISKVLEGYGKRVQYSAFECFLNSTKYNKLLRDLGKTAIGGMIMSGFIHFQCREKRK